MPFFKVHQQLHRRPTYLRVVSLNKIRNLIIYVSFGIVDKEFPAPNLTTMKKE